MAKKLVDIGAMLLEYDQLKEREKAIKNRKDQVAKIIKEYATKNGVKDANGSYYSSNEDYVFGSQARKSVKLNEEKAKEFFLEKGLYKEVIDIVEVLNEDKIEQLLSQEKVTMDEIEAITDVKVQYAIDVKVKEKEEVEEEMPVIETTSTKKKLPLKKK